MPRGRHRQSPPLSRLLPPFVGAVVTIGALAVAVLSEDPAVLRAAAALAAAVALAGAVLLRLRGRAGELAELALAEEKGLRVRQEARAEERMAELESAAESAREQAGRLNQRLLALRAQLSRAETENARLLTETAKLATERALNAARVPEPRGPEAASETSSEAKAAEDSGAAPSPLSYRRAAAVLRAMERAASVAEAQRVAARATAPKPAPEPAPRPAPKPAPAPTPAPEPARARAQAPEWSRAALPPLRPATAVPPQRPRPRSAGSAAGSTFSFFNRQAEAVGRSVGEPLEDAVTEEAYAAQEAYASVPEPNEVFDLTAEDETENVDVRGLRAASAGS